MTSALNCRIPDFYVKEKWASIFLKPLAFCVPVLQYKTYILTSFKDVLLNLKN